MINTVSPRMGDLIGSEIPLSAGVLLPRLSDEEKAVIAHQLDASAAERNRKRYERLSQVDDEKQQLLRALDANYDRSYENDNWLAEAKSSGASQADSSVKLRLDFARCLGAQKHELQANLIPAVEERLKAVIAEINSEEAAEPQIRSADLERLLTPIRAKIEHNRRQRRFEQAAAQLAARAAKETQHLAATEAEERGRALDLSVSAKPFASATSIRRRRNRIRKLALARKIRFLAHFTPLNNIASIMKYGLMSRSSLQQNDLEHVCTDHFRDDGWHDWISLSIAFPNYKMLYCKRNDMPKCHVGGWAIVRLQPRVLWELECKFMITNAANSSYWLYRGDEQSSPDSFELMFSHTNDRHNIPDCFPTDPQAEVMTKHTVPNEFILDIVTASQQDSKLLANSQSIPVTVDPRLFAPRTDWEHWKGGRRLRPHSKAFDAYIGDLL